MPNRCLWGVVAALIPLLVSASEVEEKSDMRTHAASWSQPLAEPTLVSGTTYLERVRAYAESFNARSRRSCGRRSYVEAYYDAFFYRTSCKAGACDEAAARRSADALDRSLEWRTCSDALSAKCRQSCRRAKPIRFAWLELPSTAYDWIRDSPSVSPVQHEHAKRLLLDAAGDLWPPIEFGASNRPIMLGASLARVARLFPDAPLASDWRGFAQRVFDHTLKGGDLEEDSASYAVNVWWPGFLQLTEELEASAQMWRSPVVRRLVNRVFDETAPAGVLLEYGDSASFGTASPGAIWLLEEAAARWRDPSLQWLARRIYRFHASRVRDDPPRRDAMGPKMAYLARAAWAADESLTGAPPDPRHERKITRLADPDGQEWSVRPGAAAAWRLKAPQEPLVEFAVRGADERAAAARLRIWRWDESPQRSRAHVPLFDGAPVPSSPGSEGLTRFRPWIEVEPGTELFVELSIDEGTWSLSLAGASDSSDDIRAWLGGQERPGRRAWFETRQLAGRGSTLDSRQEVKLRPRHSWGTPRQPFGFTGRTIPNKLVLRSGFDPEDAFALVNLVSGHRHGRDGRGAVAGILDGGSIVLTSTGYPYSLVEARREHENAGLLRAAPRSGPVADEAVRVEHFRDSPTITAARIRWMGSPGLEQARHFLWVKNRFLWVRDGFSLPLRGQAEAEVRWHAEAVSPVAGDDWFNISFPSPLANLWRIANPRRYLLLQFPPVAGARTVVTEDSSLRIAGEACLQSEVQDSPIPAACREPPSQVIVREWSGDAAESSEVWLDSLLAPVAAPSRPDAPGGVQSTIRRVGDAAVLEVVWQNERWTLIANPSSERLELPGLVTDAHYAVLASRPGEEPFVHVEAATRLETDSVTRRFGVRSSSESGSFRPERTLGRLEPSDH